MFVLQQVKKFTLPKAITVRLYTTFVDSILYAFTIWYAAATAKDKERQQRIIHSISNYTLHEYVFIQHSQQSALSALTFPTKKVSSGQL